MSNKIAKEIVDKQMAIYDKPIVREEVKIVFSDNHSAVDYASRGFKSLQDAYDFVETNYFKGLGKADQDEYIKWLY